MHKISFLVLSLLLLNMVSGLSLDAGSTLTLDDDQIIDGNVAVDTDLIISTSTSTGIVVNLSDGTTAEVQQTPTQARAKAKAEVQGTCTNCSIELVEVRSEGEARVAYRVEDSYSAKLFLLIPITVKVYADIDAQTGEVIDVDKSFSAYLSSRSSAQL